MDIASVKKLFFDRSAVLGAADRATRAALSRFGAFVRTRSRSSIRTRRAPSAPGSPPSGHVGTLKRAIFFAYDTARKSVIIGPVPMGRGGRGALALEQGGTITVPRLRGGRPLHYRARPFMRPAFYAELPRVPRSFRGMFR